jgi:hypothetical protein
MKRDKREIDEKTVEPVPKLEILEQPSASVFYRGSCRFPVAVSNHRMLSLSAGDLREIVIQ